MKKILFVLLFFALANPLFAVFCSKCGYQAKDSNAFCSSCGHKLDSLETTGNASDTNLLPAIESKFSPVNDFEVFVFTSNYSTCIAKYPEFQILYSKNLPAIEALEKTAHDHEKEIIGYYYAKWEILKTLQEVWSQDSGSVLRKKAYLTQYSSILRYINEIITKLKNKDSAHEVAEMKQKLAIRSSIYYVKSNFLLVANLKIPKNQPVGIKEIAGDKIEVIHLGDMAEGKTSLVGPIYIDNSTLTEPISGWVSKEEFKKRTDYAGGLN
ncbi:MAG: zinc ribbon domain-containing protein [Erysipelotrichia bacterium]|nr:zinc ribbon domain-containing protein [Erysipelotrichia bacterium]